jgi:hypothetical protein
MIGLIEWFQVSMGSLTLDGLILATVMIGGLLSKS